ncbi:senecionine N-oxygenase [Eupeodes corollae]|uniref:senecionine N-oxygenase n=1 Tax=Eupeodes corollae TaxID=290404 RepID=UPI00248F8E25|nr:senecionine N-oxygenase [Eupeodes corollae]
MGKMKVCIIGAGIAGLCSARHALCNGLEPTVYEQSDDIGGTWQYTDEIGINKYGIEVHSSMYKNLRTNLPKEVMGFPDFPIPEEEASYISSENMMAFLSKYTEKFEIRKHIQFLHHVIRIRPRNNKWEVIVKDLCNDIIKTEMFEYVMVCNGHYHTPSYPNLKGIEDFKGKAIHSHDYRSPDSFKDENVLVIGAGPSGMDLAHSVSLVAKTVILSHHLSETPKTKFNSNLIQKPDVLKVTENEAVFTDNTSIPISVILYCTGYKYSFPFLSSDCGIYIEENCIKPLYKHVLNIHYPSMAFIGIPFYVCASQMMDLQARFAMAFFCNKKPIPSQKEMLADTEEEMQKRWKMGYKKHQAHMMGPIQYEYYTDLANTAGVKNIDIVMAKLHDVSSGRFLDDLVNFRNDIFRLVDETTFIKIN